MDLTQLPVSHMQVEVEVSLADIMAKFGEALRGLTVFISDIRNCKSMLGFGDIGIAA